MRASRSLTASDPRRPAALVAGLVAAAALAIAPAPAGAAKKPTSTKATAGAVKAVVTYDLKTKPSKQYRQLRLTVTGPGGSLKKVTLPKAGRSFMRPSVTLADVNGDAVVDAIVGTFSGGAHCCTSASVALSRPGGWNKPVTQFFGNYGYVLLDLGGAPGAEFVSRDDRFAYAFASYAASIPPVQVWGIRDGAFADVTREHPDRIKADLDALVKLYADVIREGTTEEQETAFSANEPQSVTAGIVADHLLLGDLEGAKAALAKLAADGYATGGEDFFSTPKSFEQRLVDNFVEWGYLTSGAQLGL